ncbi:hypothetical protein BDZ94DRAFT_1264386 [Collybia nuda]|uniref:Uncharacterized protein n=1 Tax=Collybia nuda TaxID=64659 RepID=A0A9P6CHQ5_9AGAR|nr:hypothetical protein BDZ94DRAFT_1264386 [Collybia nuda]
MIFAVSKWSTRSTISPFFLSDCDPSSTHGFFSYRGGQQFRGCRPTVHLIATIPENRWGGIHL